VANLPQPQKIMKFPSTSKRLFHSVRVEVKRDEQPVSLHTSSCETGLCWVCGHETMAGVLFRVRNLLLIQRYQRVMHLLCLCHLSGRMCDEVTLHFSLGSHDAMGSAKLELVAQRQMVSVSRDKCSCDLTCHGRCYNTQLPISRTVRLTDMDIM